MNDWAEQAACIGKTSLFFWDAADASIAEQARAAAAEKRAKAICAECPVRVECSDHALSTREVEGVWGGMNEKERRTLLRRRRTGAGRHRIICDGCQCAFNSDKHYQQYCSVTCAAQRFKGCVA